MNIIKVNANNYSMTGKSGRIDIYYLHGCWHAGVTGRDIFLGSFDYNACNFKNAYYIAYRLYRLGY